jgi:peroxiredoxin
MCPRYSRVEYVRYGPGDGRPSARCAPATRPPRGRPSGPHGHRCRCRCRCTSLDGASAPDVTLARTAGEEVTRSEPLEEGSTVVSIDRGHWWCFCAERLQTFAGVASEFWFDDVDVLSVVTDTLEKATGMHDRYDLSIRPLADPDGEVSARYSGTERTSHGLAGIAAT